MKTKAQWEHLFRRLGVENPKQWATYEFEAGTGNLTRLAFLRELWTLVPAKDDRSWLKRWVSYEAGTQVEACEAYTRLVSAGASSEDLLALVRGVTSEFVQQTVAILDQGHPQLEDEISDQIHWRLCQISEDGHMEPLHGLHELAYGDDVKELKR